MARRRVPLYFAGRVEGADSRGTTRDRARERGVDGWVRNLDDGRVEAVFEGDPEAVEAMVEFCHEGSSRANVTDVAVSEEDPEGLSGFEVRW